jgi:putative tryptophan/tyrosine transport system substrate-binding protein
LGESVIIELAAEKAATDLGGVRPNNWVLCCTAYVAFWHKVDIHLSPGNVRYWGNSGRHGFTVSCLLLTQTGHYRGPSHFLSAGWTRYDALSLTLGEAMRRRDFIGLLSGATITWSLTARAQQPDGVRRIGVLTLLAATDEGAKRQLSAFVRQLEELGWAEGRNLQIDYRWGAGDPERMQVFAKELVELQPNAILARSTPVTAALLRQTRTIPIVFTVVSDPVGERFVESLARPGGNVTGFTNVEFSLTGKWLELLKEIAPGIKRVAFIFDPKVSPGGGSYYTHLIEASAATSAMAPTVAPVHDAVEIERAIGEFVREQNGGLIVLPDATTVGHRELIVALAARHRVPAIYAFRDIVVDGGLISYGIDVVEQYRQAAGYVDRILKGAKPAELPVQLPAKFEMTINLKTAKTLGLDVPLLLQQRADEVIE